VRREILRVRESPITLHLLVVTICNCSMNPITNPNPVYGHSYNIICINLSVKILDTVRQNMSLCSGKCVLHFRRNILWRNRPMREVITFRNFKECDCTTVAERCRVLPPLPSPRFASLHVLLCYVVTIGSRNSKEGRRNIS
jgi:hypothetical protein